MRETVLLLEGVYSDSITVGFLVDVMDVAEMHGYPIEGISVMRGEVELFVDRDPSV